MVKGYFVRPVHPLAEFSWEGLKIYFSDSLDDLKTLRQENHLFVPEWFISGPYKKQQDRFILDEGRAFHRDTEEELRAYMQAIKGNKLVIIRESQFLPSALEKMATDGGVLRAATSQYIATSSQLIEGMK